MEKNYRGGLIDGCLVLLVLLLNPLNSTFIFDTKSSLPDTFAYIAQAQNLLDNMQFHTGPWGHVDTALILPPLYPLLVAMVMATGMEGLESALSISRFSGYLFSLAAFAYLRAFTGPWLAAVSVLALQLTYVYFNFATLALTEPLFLALMMATLLLVSRYLADAAGTGSLRPVALGVACSLVFLCREAGITVLLLVLILVAVAQRRDAITRASALARPLALVVLGFSALTVPYYAIRGIQTGADPLTRSFRLGYYTVVASDPAIRERAGSMKRGPGATYADIYSQRRSELELLPDGSEMLRFVFFAEGGHKRQDIYGNIISAIASPGKYVKQVSGKVQLLGRNAGFGILLLFIITAATSFLLPLKGFPRRLRIIIPLHVILYILLLALFASQITRYLAVIVPLVLIHICLELHLLLRSCRWPAPSGDRVPAGIVLVLFPLIVLAGSPALFHAKQIYPRDPLRVERLEELRGKIGGAPVFAQFPVFAHAAGGSFRQLPNDGLDKIARYAEKTGVRWLLVVDIPEERAVMKFWTNAYEWLILKDLQSRYPDVVEYCCGWHVDENGHDWRLYSFK